MGNLIRIQQAISTRAIFVYPREWEKLQIQVPVIDWIHDNMEGLCKEEIMEELKKSLNPETRELKLELIYFRDQSKRISTKKLTRLLLETVPEDIVLDASLVPRTKPYDVEIPELDLDIKKLFSNVLDLFDDDTIMDSKEDLIIFVWCVWVVYKYKETEITI